MYERLIKPPKGKSFFLFGARGTGKTTWVRASLPGALYLDLLESEIYNDLLANPQRLENFIPRLFNNWIIIDEVQKVPQLLNEVHRLIEKNKYNFVLTGSSARKLRKGGQNLLAGRALTYRMYPFCSAELGDNFDAKFSLKNGMLPSVYTENDPKAYLESYVKTYLEEEIKQERLTRNLSSFARFLEAASFSQGSTLNMSSIARESAVERKVIEDYFTILEDLLIAYRIPVFTKKAKRKMAQHPKFYFFDTGVYRTLRPSGVLDMPEEIEGIALETLLLQELISLNDSLKLNYKIYYWRTADKTEVDFILYDGNNLLAFEIKRSGRITSDMFKGLKSFLKDYPKAKAFLIYGGSRYNREGDIECLPFLDIFTKILDILTKGAYIVS